VKENCTSALDKPFKFQLKSEKQEMVTEKPGTESWQRYKNKSIFTVKLTCILLSLLVYHFLFLSFSTAEILDRVVAVVNDEIILFSEVEEAFQEANDVALEVTREEVLDGLINRILLLNQAKNIKRKHIYSVKTEIEDNILINEYVEKRLKAFIRIPYTELELFYQENKEFFTEEFLEVRDEIEAYLIEIELNKRLSEHLEKLREEAYIRVQLEG
jgi:parvulin-like peptidyl-prolyl isomerase